jgi:hypothetical protein
VPVRSPHLYDALRSFCLAAFAALGPEMEEVGEIPFVVDRHDGLYEYRPLLRDQIEARAYALSQLEDARIALADLSREPAATIFTRGLPGAEPGAERVLYRTILLPLLVRTAEACGGFDWEDGAFNRVYGELEQSLFGTARVYAAASPLVGLSVGQTVDLGRGIQVRATTPAELASRWPESGDLLPPGFGEEPERSAVLSLSRDLLAGETIPPDAPAELADAVTALRLATGAPIAAGPVVFEQLDRHPFEARPMLGIAATEPGGEPTRLDPWRGALAGDLLARLSASEREAGLGEALELWELALFEAEPLRSERLREALVALLGGLDGPWAAAMRAAMLLGETSPDRARLIEGLRALARGEEAGEGAVDTLRRTIVETVLHDEPDRLIADLDDALLGLRARPPGYYGTRALRHDSGAAA